MNKVIRNSTIIDIVISLLAFDTGSALRVKAGLVVLNPLLISTILVIDFMVVFSIDYGSYIRGMRYLNYLLTPVTVALTVPLYQQLQPLEGNLFAVVLGVLASMLTSLSSILVLCTIPHVNHMEYITLLPKSITTAIDMSVVKELGNYTAIAVASIIVTGILSNVFADPIYHLFVIHNLIAEGLALGTSAHAIGTSEITQIGKIEGTMAGLAIAVSGITTVVGASIFTTFR